jgi:hypothetical protein
MKQASKYEAAGMMVGYAKGQVRCLPPPDASFKDWQIEAQFQVPPAFG